MMTMSENLFIYFLSDESDFNVTLRNLNYRLHSESRSEAKNKVADKIILYFYALMTYY